MSLDILTLAAASGSDGGLGKITTVPAAATLFVRCPAGPTIEHLDWIVACNKAHSLYLYRSRTILNSPTITLASAQDGDAVVVNGLTFTGETTAEDAVASARKFLVGGTDTAAAAALAALLNDATYGVPGIAATSALGVVTVPSLTSYVTQCITSVGGARVVCAQTLPLGLVRDFYTSGLLDNSAYGGWRYEQWIYGWEQAYLAITNNDGSNAATVTVKAARYRYR